MNIKRIREYLQHLPGSGQEILLNASYQSGEHEAVLAMLTKQEDKLLLWEAARSVKEDEDMPDESRISRTYRKNVSNREIILNSLKEKDRLPVRRLIIGSQSYTVTSASGTSIEDECNIKERLMLLHFLEQGVSLGGLEQESLKHLRLNCYEMEEKELPHLCGEKIPQCSVELDSCQIPVMLNRKICVRTGEYKKPYMVKVDGGDKTGITFWIHGITFFDPWEDARTRFQGKSYTERFTKQEISRMEEKFRKALPGFCPEGWVVPLAEYECREECQLQFYRSAYLKEAAERKDSSMALLFRTEKKTGSMGYLRRVCPLNPIKKPTRQMTLELLLYYKKIPGETVCCKQNERASM